MAWALTTSTFWQRSGKDVLVANDESVLRLNEVSAIAFESLLALAGDQLDAAPLEVQEVYRQLVNEHMIERCEHPSDYRAKQLGNTCCEASCSLTSGS
jgi:hypothetical protein